MELRTYHVETWGCQMNVLDSQHLAGILEARKLAPSIEAADADVVLLNTCAVREKAVQKVLSRLGELRQSQVERGTPRVVGLCGCVAEQEGARLLARARVLDFVLGPGRVGQLGAALDAVAAGTRPAVTGFAQVRDIDAHLAVRSGPRQFVTVVHGCNQHCTFCVVPYTRGHEVSRTLEDIVAEVAAVADAGAREVTLLGQTVNAYRCPESGADFADLLAAVGEVKGPWRIQFLTSHPAYFSARLIEAMSRCEKLGTYVHVPFQAGSDKVLARMHRRYTRDGYRQLVGELRAALPRVTLSTDVIVGFPGEDGADFDETLSLVEEVRFGQLYGFVYSPRPRTPAARYSNRVEAREAKARIARLFALQSGIQLELNQARIGTSGEVLVDGPAKRGEGLWQGRGDDNRVVNFRGWDGLQVGDVVQLTIVGATPHALLGERPRSLGGAASITASA